MCMYTNTRLHMRRTTHVRHSLPETHIDMLLLTAVHTNQKMNLLECLSPDHVQTYLGTSKGQGHLYPAPQEIEAN